MAEMEKKFNSAEEYIAYLEKKSEVHSRMKKYTLPNSLLDGFDMFEFAKYTTNKDMYTVLMRAEPFSEFDVWTQTGIWTTSKHFLSKERKRL